MNRLQISIAAGLMLILGSGLAFAGPLDNLLTNGSFEEGVFQLPETHAYSRQIREQGWAVDDPVVQPEGWCITPLAGQSGAFRLTEDSKESHSGLRSVYLKGHLIQERKLDASAGDQLELTYWSRSDTGSDVCLKIFAYGQNANGEDVWLDELKEIQIHSAGAEWEKISEKIKVPAKINNEAVVALKAVLYSTQGAFFDDVEISVSSTP